MRSALAIIIAYGNLQCLSFSCQFLRSLLVISALTPAFSQSYPRSLPLTPAPIRAHSRSLPRLSMLTPAPIHAHSHSSPHVLTHEYLRENDKSRTCYAQFWMCRICGKYISSTHTCQPSRGSPYFICRSFGSKF